MYVLSGGISGLLRKEIKSWRSKKRAPSHEANGKRRTTPIAMEDTICGLKCICATNCVNLINDPPTTTRFSKIV